MVVCVSGAGHVLFVLGCTPQVEHAGSVLDENEPKRCNKDAAKITHGLKNLGAEVITGLDDGVPGRSALICNGKRVHALGVKHALLLPCCCCRVENDRFRGEARRRLQRELRARGGQTLGKVEIGGGVGGGSILNTR
jgi:hypothetical protein